MSPTKAKANGAGTNRAQRRFKRVGTVLLRFEDPELEGLEVRARRVSLGFAMELGDMAETLDEGQHSTREYLDRTRDFLALFAEKVLASWNVDREVLGDDGEPTGEVELVEPTVEGLMSLDLPFVMAVFQAWMVEVAGVSGPLGTPSPNGSPSVVPPIPMDELSPSLES